MFPYSRLRRTRKYSWLRDLVAEVSLSCSDLVLPVFIKEGRNIKEAIKSMPDVFVYSIDKLEEIAKYSAQQGIRAIALFPQIEPSLKTLNGEEAYNQDNLICRAIRHLKNLNLNLGIICDVALDPYTSHGHDGIVINSVIDNDLTIEALQNQAHILSKAGADMLAPSDMMDGRIGAIRDRLEEYGFGNIPIISYAAKYSSSLYGPFRDAVGSKINLANADKKTYQMDYRNIKEAIREVELDVCEGADIVLVKPGVLYLDIIKEIKNHFTVPVFSYHVSGEYSMLKLAAANNFLDYENALMETLFSLKRAGSSAIFTYAALDAAKIINSGK